MLFMKYAEENPNSAKRGKNGSTGLILSSLFTISSVLKKSKDEIWSKMLKEI